MEEEKPKPGLLSRLARPFAALGRRPAAPSDGKETDAWAEDSLERDHSVVDDAFSMALNDLLNEEEERYQTRLQVISLVEFHEAVGTKWLRLKDKVMLIAEGVINQHIGPGNAFGRRGDDFFVLLFRSVSQAEGRRRAVIIAQELGTRLVGAQFAGGERPLALAAELSLDDALGPGGILRLDAIESAVGQVRAILPPAGEDGGYRPHPGGGPEDEQGRIHRAAALPAEDGLRELRAHMRPEALPRPQEDQPLRRSMMPSAPATAGSDETPRQVAAPTWTAIPIGGAGKDGVAADPGLSAAPPLPGDATLTVGWRPVWTAEPEAIAAYKAHIQRMDAPGQTPWEGVRAYPPGDDDAAIALDKVVVGAVARALRTPEGAGSAALAVVPIHWASMASGQRQAVLSPLGNLPQEVRSTRLMFDLFGVPDDVGADGVAAALRALAPLCRRVGLRGALGRFRVERAARVGAWALGVDLAELSPDEHTDDARLLASLSALRRQSAEMGLAAYAWGIRRRAVVAGTVQDGFAMICGPGLMKDLPRFAKALPAPKARLLG